MHSLNSANFAFSFSGTVSDVYPLFTPTIPFIISKNQSITSGTGQNQMNRIWADTGKLHNGHARTYDLTGGVSGVFGTNITLNTVRIIAIVNRSSEYGSAAEIAVSTNGLGFISGAAPAIVVPACSPFVVCNLGCDGWIVTNGSADTIVLTNLDSNNGAWYDILVGGTTIEESSSSSSLSSGSSSSTSSSS